MINTTALFAIDDIIAEQNNKLNKIQTKISNLFRENENKNRAKISDLISERDYLNNRITELNNKRQKILNEE